MELYEVGAQNQGNTAKLHILEELWKIKSKKLKVLDIGCAGPLPLQFWEPIFNNGMKFEFHGVDVAKVDEAERIAKEKKWDVKLYTLSAYELDKVFTEPSFDVVVSTQVLEHVTDRKRFVEQLASVTKRGGVVYLSMDSGHAEHNHHNHGAFEDPIGFIKCIGKDILVHFAGMHRYYDTPVKEGEIEPVFRDYGFEIEEKRFYNVHPLKRISSDYKGELKPLMMRNWKMYEDLLNENKEFLDANKHYFLALYYKLKKL